MSTMLASPDPISLPAPTFNAWYHQSRRQAYLKTGRQSSLTRGLKRAHTAPERSTSDTAADVQIVADQRSTPLTADRLQEQCQHDPAYCIHRWLDSQDTSEHLFVDEPSLHEQCQSWQISDATNLSTKQSVKNDAKHDTVLQWPGEEVFLHLGTWDTSWYVRILTMLNIC